MKVLWLINSPFSKLCAAAGLPSSVKEGWIEGLFGGIMNSENRDSLELVISFPQMEKNEMMTGEVEGCRFYGFYKEHDKPYAYSEKVTSRLKEIVDMEKPDVVHIAGTEYDHAYSMVRAFPYPEKTLVSIQGLTSVYARHYMADLPFTVRYGFTFRDLVKLDNLYMDWKKYVKRGMMETEVIKSAGHIAGRTMWDYSCCRRINPKAVYHHCGEILRSSFYDGMRWSYEGCRKHSMFVSQGYVPLKGLHYVLEALCDIRVHYPDVHLYVAGNVTLNNDSFKAKLRQKNYQRYLAKLIDKYGIRENVEFLPSLNEREMKDYFLKSNVFVLPSSIENSPNSLGEAMILGVPCVAAHVGGVADMMEHNVQGYIYQHDAPYMLAGYVMKVFEECDSNIPEIERMTDAAALRAQKLFSKDINSEAVLSVYGGIYEKKADK